MACPASRGSNVAHRIADEPSSGARSFVLNRNAIATAMLLAASGCLDAAVETQLLVPDEVSLYWDGAFNEVEDGLGAVIPVDLMVYESESGEPVGGTPLELSIDRGVATALGPEAVVPQGVDACESDWCVWDAWQDRYVLLDEDGRETDALSVTTDRDGLARVYIYVDSFPASGADFEPLPVLVSMGERDVTFQLVPQ